MRSAKCVRRRVRLLMGAALIAAGMARGPSSQARAERLEVSSTG